MERTVELDLGPSSDMPFSSSCDVFFDLNSLLSNSSHSLFAKPALNPIIRD